VKPAAFEYHRPDSVTEATELLADLGHDAELLAGNQSLGIIMANRLATPDHLVDLGQV
jgi:carbon-monoxide dehydrogenase medium subunit